MTQGVGHELAAASLMPLIYSFRIWTAQYNLLTKVLEQGGQVDKLWLPS